MNSPLKSAMHLEKRKTHVDERASQSQRTSRYSETERLLFSSQNALIKIIYCLLPENLIHSLWSKRLSIHLKNYHPRLSSTWQSFRTIGTV